MATLITYNSVNPFAEISSIPFISKQDESILFHNRWDIKTTIILKGNITGDCTNDFTQLTDRQRQLINSFSEDHKDLVIQEQGQTIYTAPYSIIQSINFPSTNYVRILPYEITLSCFQSNLFSGVFGIETPKHTVEYSEDEKGIISVSRVIGAKGFSTTSSQNINNALINAKTWVQARTGWSKMDSMGYPSFVTITGNLSPCLKEFSEKINRMEGSYEVTENYEFRDGCSGTALLRYSTDINYNDQEGLYTVALDGNFDGCYGITITGLRSTFTGINTYNLANNSLKGSFSNAPDLNGEWLSKSIEEDTNKKNITFKYNYDTDYIPKVLFEKEFNVDVDYIEDLHNITLQGTIKARGSQKERWERVYNYYLTQINIFNLISNFFASRGYPYTLNPFPLNNQTTFDKFAGEIKINATYNNRPLPPPGVREWDYTITINPALNLISYLPNLCQDYIVMDIRSAKRATASIDGTALILSNSDFSTQARNYVAALLVPYISGSNQIIKVDNIERSIAAQGYQYSFNRSVAFNGTVFVP